MAADLKNLNARAQAVQAEFAKLFPEFSTTSGHRGHNHNHNVGGAKSSQHLSGNAFDYVPNGNVSDARKAEALNWLRSQGANGFGTYRDGSFHADFRQSPAAWGPNKKSTSLGQTPQYFQDFARQHVGGAPRSAPTVQVPAGAPAAGAPAATAAARATGFTVSPEQYFGGDVSKLPAGLRNNNPGNIKYVGQSAAIGPSVNKDEGDPQAVYPSPHEGAYAMGRLLQKKFDGGKNTVNKMIAEKMGWTPGNYGAAANIARTMGVDPNAELNLRDPAQMSSFMRALVRQEHGEAGSNAVRQDVYDYASNKLAGRPVTDPTTVGTTTVGTGVQPLPQTGGGGLLGFGVSGPAGMGAPQMQAPQAPAPAPAPAPVSLRMPAVAPPAQAPAPATTGGLLGTGDQPAPGLPPGLGLRPLANRPDPTSQAPAQAPLAPAPAPVAAPVSRQDGSVPSATIGDSPVPMMGWQQDQRPNVGATDAGITADRPEGVTSSVPSFVGAGPVNTSPEAIPTPVAPVGGWTSTVPSETPDPAPEVEPIGGINPVGAFGVEGPVGTGVDPAQQISVPAPVSGLLGNGTEESSTPAPAAVPQAPATTGAPQAGQPGQGGGFNLNDPKTMGAVRQGLEGLTKAAAGLAMKGPLHYAPPPSGGSPLNTPRAQVPDIYTRQPRIMPRIVYRGLLG